jgi:hypothetical protein
VIWPTYVASILKPDLAISLRPACGAWRKPAGNSNDQSAGLPARQQASPTAGAVRSSTLQCAVAVAASLLALASCSSSPSVAIKPAAAPPGPSCAWSSVIGVQTSNRIIPDLAAAYWDQPITARPSTRVTISGIYPDARYLSLGVYTRYATPFTAGGVSSSLPARAARRHLSCRYQSSLSSLHCVERHTRY